MKKLIIDYMDSIWNTVCEDTMFDRVHKKFGISFDEFYRLVTSDSFEDCEECNGHGVKEVSKYVNGEFYGDVPTTCGECCGMGRVIKEPNDIPVELFMSHISKLF